MTTQQPYASREESASVIVGDTRSPEEKLVDKMIADAGAHEQGAEYVSILYRVAVQLAAQRNHFHTLAQDNGAIVIRTAVECNAAMNQRDELLAALKHIESHGHKLSFDAVLYARATLTKHQPPAAPAAIKS